LKILNFISGKDLGGPKQSFLLYSQVLDNLGYDVYSIVKKGAKLKDILIENNLKVYEVNYFRISFGILKKIAIYQISKIVKDIQPDLIFVHKQIDISFLREIFPSTKIIAIAHWYSFNHIQKSDAIIAVSNKVKDYLVQNGYKKDIFVISNMTKLQDNIECIDIAPIPMIGAMGVFRRKKGFHNLIKALGILKQQNIQFRAIIAGKGQLYFYLQYLKYRLNLKNELQIIPWVDNKSRNNFLDSLDIFVLPSRIETFGMVVVEAMARGKRIIATKCGGAEEIIDDGIDGYLVEKQNPKVLAEKIIYMIENPQDSKDFCKKSIDKVKKKYSQEKISKQIEKVVNKY
jgi:glycosyltransferase involved in cell wall biosynthesis